MRRQVLSTERSAIKEIKITAECVWGSKRHNENEEINQLKDLLASSNDQEKSSIALLIFNYAFSLVVLADGFLLLANGKRAEHERQRRVINTKTIQHKHKTACPRPLMRIKTVFINRYQI